MILEVMMHLRSMSLYLAVGLVTSSSARADVLIGNGPGSPYMGVAHAVGVAHDGDVVLLRAAVAENVTVAGKGIAIVADVPGHLTWTGTLAVRAVPAGSTVLISGFAFGQSSTTPLVISQNDGAVRIQDCGMSAIPIPGQPARVAIECTASRDVAFLRCGLQGGWGPGYPFWPVRGAPALVASDSTITIHASNVAGGPGMDGVYIGSGGGTPGTSGGSGIVMSGGTLVLQSALVHGGAGGAGYPGYYGSAGGAGGTGLVLTAGSSARAIGGRTLGGVGGLGGVGAMSTGADGAHGFDVDASGGSWSRIEGVARALIAPRIVRTEQPLSIDLAGAPGEQVFLAFGSVAARTDWSALEGVLLLQPIPRRLGYGHLDAQGAMSLALTTPVLPAGAENDLIHLQTLFADALGQAHVGCAQVVVRVDASY
jgi:hypothetical protein